MASIGFQQQYLKCFYWLKQMITIQKGVVQWVEDEDVDDGAVQLIFMRQRDAVGKYVISNEIARQWKGKTNYTVIDLDRKLRLSSIGKSQIEQENDFLSVKYCKLIRQTCIQCTR